MLLSAILIIILSQAVVQHFDTLGIDLRKNFNDGKWRWEMKYLSRSTNFPSSFEETKALKQHAVNGLSSMAL